MTISRIVAGVDLSDASVAAAQWAAREPAPQAEIVLTHVMTFPKPPPILRSRYPKHELTSDTLRFGADQKLRALSHTLRPRRVWPELLDGDPGTALAAVAKAYEADMIVVGAHGSSETTAGLGSTVNGVLRETTVPVLILGSRPPSAPFHLLVPVEHRDSAQWAISFARSFAPDRAHRMTLFHVIPSRAITHFLARAEWDDIDDDDDFQWTDRWTRLARDAGWDGDNVRSEEAFGDPTYEIRAAAERLTADFIVIPRRNAGGLRRKILGSVSEAIVRHTSCSVIVVPERDTSTLNERAASSSSTPGNTSVR